MSTKAAASTVTRTTPYDELPEWLSVREAATYWNVCEWFIRKQIDSGDIPSRRLGNKLILIPKGFFASPPLRPTVQDDELVRELLNTLRTIRTRRTARASAGASRRREPRSA